MRLCLCVCFHVFVICSNLIIGAWDFVRSLLLYHDELLTNDRIEYALYVNVNAKIDGDQLSRDWVYISFADHHGSQKQKPAISRPRRITRDKTENQENQIDRRCV